MAEMKLQHLVITRLTIKLFYDEFSPEWLEERLRLFRTYCVPSMADQTSEEYQWLILCDETTDPGFVKSVEESRSLVPQLRVLYTSKRGGGIPDVVRPTIHADTELLVTTRLDGDDSLHAETVAVVQAYAGAFARSSNRTWLLNFPYGYRYDEVDRRLYAVYWLYSPFSSLFEKLRVGKRFENVYRNHHKLHLFNPAHFDLSLPAWMQVIHGHADRLSGTAVAGNRMSGIRSTDKEVDPAEVGEVFGMNLAETGSPS
jgi:Putative rhamnosyl transferase